MSNSNSRNGESGVPRPEYPRPDFIRDQWLNLNGHWEFAFDDDNVGLKNAWFSRSQRLERSINVPFAYQAPLSEIGDATIHEVVWYAREFLVPAEWPQDGDVLLHFGAVDYRCQVWLNGHEIGHNQGGHVPFSINCRKFLSTGMNRLVLRVEDSQSKAQPRGKQSHTGIAHGIDYLCTTGIWQTVWLEPVGNLRFDAIRMEPRLSEFGDKLDILAYLHAPWGSYEVEAVATHNGKVLGHQRVPVHTSVAKLTLDLPKAPRWSPDAPNLIDITLRLWSDGHLLDDVDSYTGLREVAIQNGKLMLNGEPLYLRMVLDQGYWSDGLMTAPSDEALRRDVDLIKAMGFNGVRKHQKVEDPRWLTWCDRIGLLVWGEMANAREWSAESLDAFFAEWERAVRRDANHPSIMAWVPVNESWGVPSLEEQPAQVAFVERLVEVTRRLDGTRPVIDNDGWEHTDVGDIAAIHDYTPDGEELRSRWVGGLPQRTWGRGRLAHFIEGAEYRGQPIVLSEVGGFLLLPPGKEISEMDRLYTVYGSHRTAEELLVKYAALMRGIGGLGNVTGYCYTQLTDIEPEINGLLTANREPKVPIDAIRDANFSTGYETKPADL